MHPDAKSLRARSIENYNELSAIIDDNHAKGCWFTSGAKGDLNPISNSEQHVETPLQNMLVDEERSVDNTGDRTQGSSQRTKGRPSTSSHSEEPSKKRRYNDVLVEMMSALAANIGRIADALTGSHQSLCLDELFAMVKNIPGFDDDLIIEACEFLSFDDKRAMMFMKLNERWLEKFPVNYSSLSEISSQQVSRIQFEIAKISVFSFSTEYYF
ncbi:uncharacterized protein LOC132314114 [Cornus florida]|uniref:uncharacterized protein LOC132314114 n=1 Tax=Cornus florida TaxID=4283 RepID=UPI0028A0762A|nr:uncharacterized protein LOC132314114 [Cornus florida]